MKKDIFCSVANMRIFTLNRYLLIFLLLTKYSPLFCSSSRYGTEVGRLTPKLVSQIRRFLPTARQMAEQRLNQTIRAEMNFVRRRGRQKGRSRSRSVQRFFGSSPSAKRTSFSSFVMTNTLNITRLRFGLTKQETEALIVMLGQLPPMLSRTRIQALPDQMPSVPPANMCPFPSVVGCNPQRRFRTVDGSCNNLQNPSFGMSMQPFLRLLPPDYADKSSEERLLSVWPGIQEPRKASDGSDLPSARLVSLVVHDEVDSPSDMFTHILMLTGQFTDHDITRTAISTLATAESPSTDQGDVDCGVDGCQTSAPEQAACFPITVPANDTDFAGFPCLEFVRTLEVPNMNCVLGPREQLNQLTSWLDASLVYGNNMEDYENLLDRSNPNRGRLRSQPHPYNNRLKELLPPWPQFDECETNGTLTCFRAGDGRVNENVALMGMHTAFMREHNRIEAFLHELNPHWDGKRLLQEARRILIAEWQHIVYNEYLPAVLGPFIMSRFGITLQNSGYYDGYDNSINPDAANGWATAAFRFGHSQIQSNISLFNAWFQQVASIPLSTTFRNPTNIYNPNNQGYDFVLRGMFTDPSQTVDSFVTKQVTEFLFTINPPITRSMDLIALNIQRGRDHGIPAYNNWREFCGLGKVSSFDDLLGLIPSKVIQKYKSLYRSVDDIDLFTAGLSEWPAPGSILGPTFACLVAEQFSRLRKGDRFWYENNVENPYPFTKDQLTQIRKATLARILCNNGDFMTHIQPRVMLQPFSNILNHIRKTGDMDLVYRAYPLYHGNWNDVVHCQQIPDVDLRFWQEVPPHTKEATDSSTDNQAKR